MIYLNPIFRQALVLPFFPAEDGVEFKHQFKFTSRSLKLIHKLDKFHVKDNFVFSVGIEQSDESIVLFSIENGEIDDVTYS